MLSPEVSVPVSREKIDKFWLVDSVNSPPPGFWTFAADVHGSKHTLEFKEHPQPRISWVPHCSPESLVAASVSVFHGCPGIQGPEKTSKLHNHLELLQKQPASAFEEETAPAVPISLPSHLNVTVQTLAKSWELPGRSEQEWGR